eukprot:TRINITY_DN75710_c0_g1_i1.p1 TRINITY_DN75710_c0_g1~~TRINITY_DN75710_c0_g1_i1.p1  ORF type:complete len:267 (+),score=38.50 TRINITY_DN75710_c0_g1_i1:138-938(+)
MVIRRPRYVAPKLPRVKPCLASKMSYEIQIGKRSKPTVLVVLFHGLGDNALGSAKWAKRLADGLPGSLVVVPQAPDRCYWDIKKKSAKQGSWDWLRQHGKQQVSDRQSTRREIHRVVRARRRHVDKWLDRLLAKHKLTNKHVILAGYSQGSIVAATVGARRGVLGVLVCGGVTWQQIYSEKHGGYVDEDRPLHGWNRWEVLMPSKSSTSFCAINGSADPYVLRRPLEKMLRPYCCEWTWHEGQGHDFPASWNRESLLWMKFILGIS